MRALDDAAYYKCGACGYEFLSKGKKPTCPRCRNDKLESKDIRVVVGLDE